MIGEAAMECSECNGTYRLRTDQYKYVDPYIGSFSIEGKPYYKCDNCDEVLLTLETTEAIEEEKNKLLQELIGQFPVSDFITVAETLKLLGITRQGLHKNSKIQNGFIYKIKIGNSSLYLKQSVIRFKETGDGRFILHENNYDSRQKYSEDTVMIESNIYLERHQNITQTTNKVENPYLKIPAKILKSKKVKIYAN